MSNMRNYKLEHNNSAIIENKLLCLKIRIFSKGDNGNLSDKRFVKLIKLYQAQSLQRKKFLETSHIDEI